MIEDASGDSMEFCGLDGPAEGMPTRHEINTLIRTASAIHLKRIKRNQELHTVAIAKIDTDLQSHLKEEAATRNQLKGIKIAFGFVAAILAFSFPLLLKILEAVKLLAK